MAAGQDSRISEFDPITALDGTEQMIFVQGAETRQGTVNDVKTFFNSNIRCVKVTKTFTDFSFAGLTNDISLYTLGIKEYISDIKIVPTTAFSGGAIASYTLSVGIVGSLAKYAVAANVFTGNTTTTAVHTPIAGLESLSATTDIRGAAVATGGNLSTATAGAVTFYLFITTLP